METINKSDLCTIVTPEFIHELKSATGWTYSNLSPKLYEKMINKINQLGKLCDIQ